MFPVVAPRATLAGAALALLAIPLLIVMAPAPALAQAGGTGQAFRIAPLDDLFTTAHEYLTGDSVLQVLATAPFLSGLLGLLRGRFISALAGAMAGSMTASVPDILHTLFSQGRTALALCG